MPGPALKLKQGMPEKILMYAGMVAYTEDKITLHALSMCSSLNVMSISTRVEFIIPTAQH